ncbi:MAG: ankyrin repeat domain-containing protein [Phycisphaeraceae bacterium]
MFGLSKKSSTRLWESLLADEINQVRELLEAEPSLAEARPTWRVHRRDEAVHQDTPPLHFAAARGNAHVAKLLLVAGASVNATARPDGATALHEAATCGHREVAEVLLLRHADVNAQDDHGRTSVHRAALAGHDDLVMMLLAHGAATDLRDGDGNTLLHCAAAGGCEQAVHKLIADGADVDACNDRKQRTPLHLVVMGADHSAYRNTTPERREARARMERIARMLLERGADVNALDSTGDTPLDLLNFMLGDDESDALVKLLRKRGGHWMRYHHRHAAGETVGGEHVAEPTSSGGPGPLARSGHMAVSDADPRAGAEKAAAETDEAIELGSDPLIIGRLPECEVRFRSRTLSRRHAEISCDHGEYVIRDLGSQNGVLINGHRIHAPHLLSGGEHIALGVYEFHFDGHRLVPLTSELSEEELESEGTR